MVTEGIVESFHVEIKEEKGGGEEGEEGEEEANQAAINGGSDGGGRSGGSKLMDFIPIYVPAVQRGLMLDEDDRHEKRFLDFLRARPSRDWFVKPAAFAGRLWPRGRDAVASPPPPTGDIAGDELPAATTEEEDEGQPRRRHRFRVPFVRKISWVSLWSSFKSWIKVPANVAMFIWLVFVVSGLIVLFLVTLGLLNDEIPSSSRRKKWTEVINQILNALFMIMCLYQHPRISHHLWLLINWSSSPENQKEVLAVYSKVSGEPPRRHDRLHMTFVVILLHITCVSQYALCGLFWGYSRSERPDWAVNLCIAVGTVAPIVAGVYTVKGPLGRRRRSSDEEEAAPASPVSVVTATEEDELRRYNRRVVVTSPDWIGSSSDCCDDGTVCLLSTVCPFCVFGWNVERLGFGNMYVHIFTFILLCVGPFLVFSAAALSIEDYGVRYSVGVVGILLCPLGLLYGGFWRTQMRKRFRLPEDGRICGSPAAADCLRWLCCCWPCALAQEVRTANFYDVAGDGFYESAAKGEDERQVVLPSRRDAGDVVAAREMGPRSLSWSVNMAAAPAMYGESIAGYLSPAAVAYERAATYGSSEQHQLRPPIVPLIILGDERRRQ